MTDNETSVKKFKKNRTLSWFFLDFLYKFAV